MLLMIITLISRIVKWLKFGMSVLHGLSGKLETCKALETLHSYKVQSETLCDFARKKAVFTVFKPLEIFKHIWSN